jgi:hypothetical protein
VVDWLALLGEPGGPLGASQMLELI